MFFLRSSRQNLCANWCNSRSASGSRSVLLCSSCTRSLSSASEVTLPTLGTPDSHSSRLK